jgi:hypothetical protein
MITAIFRDTEMQARFERDGYLVFDFLSPEQIAGVAAQFYEVHDKIPQGFYSTASITNDEIKNSISDHAQKIIAPELDKVFQNFRILGISFLCKTGGEQSKVAVHSDWMVVDESKYFSGTLWIPTIDTTEENGALKVLPGSHKFFNQLRSSSIAVPYKGYEQEIWDNMITVPMKAGQAFLLNHAVLHASSANMTSKERLILVCGIIPAEAKLSYYHGTERGTVEKFDMPDDMFMRHAEIGNRPLIGTKVSEFDYVVKAVSREQMEQLINQSKSYQPSKLKSENASRQNSAGGILTRISKRIFG